MNTSDSSFTVLYERLGSGESSVQSRHVEAGPPVSRLQGTNEELKQTLVRQSTDFRATCRAVEVLTLTLLQTEREPNQRFNENTGVSPFVHNLSRRRQRKAPEWHKPKSDFR